MQLRGLVVLSVVHVGQAFVQARGLVVQRGLLFVPLALDLGQGLLGRQLAMVRGLLTFRRCYRPLASPSFAQLRP